MIIAITGCSGSGKSFVSNVLSEKIGAIMPTHTTTRAPRKDDNGFYKYVTKERFLNMITNNEFFIASGDGRRYYGVEMCELEEAKKISSMQIINVSLKDIGTLSGRPDTIIVLTKHRNFVRDFFRKGIIDKVGIVEAINRFFIYLYDYLHNYRKIKSFVSYIVVFEDKLSSIEERIDEIVYELVGAR